MLETPDTAVEGLRNPFTPNWGVPPRQFVGRDEMISSILDALRAGPETPAYTTLLIGPRGSGKTASLRVMEDAVRTMGWHVIQIDTTGASIEERIKGRIRHLYSTSAGLPDLAGDEHTETRSTELRFFSFARWRKKKTVRWVAPFEADDLHTHCQRLAEHAAERGVGALITLDELHNGDPDQLRALFGVLQFVTKGDGSPLAFVGAGLPQLRDMLFSGDKTTFLQRCHKEYMTPFSKDDAETCLVTTAAESGGTIEAKALQMLSEHSGTLPYRVQLLGYSAWELSDAPAVPIDVDAAAGAIEKVNKVWFDDVAVYAWRSLNETSQRLLAALADLGGTASSADLASRLNASLSAQRAARERLVQIGCLEVLPSGELHIAGMFGVEDVRRLAPPSDEYVAGKEDVADAGNHTGPNHSKCGFLMPRAGRPCALPPGHAGRHRSK